MQNAALLLYVILYRILYAKAAVFHRRLRNTRTQLLPRPRRPYDDAVARGVKPPRATSERATALG
jgi:hypothetical protein